MMRVSVLVCVFLAIIVNCSDVPTITVTAYDDNRYFFSLPDEEGITSVYFHGIFENVQNAALLIKPAEGVWSADINAGGKHIEVGDVLEYEVTIKKNGVEYSTGTLTFEVKEVLPKSSRPKSTIDLLNTKDEAKV